VARTSATDWDPPLGRGQGSGDWDPEPEAESEAESPDFRDRASVRRHNSPAARCATRRSTRTDIILVLTLFCSNIAILAFCLQITYVNTPQT